MTPKQYGYVASAVFALVGAGHLWRIFAGWPVIIGAASVPMWPSWIALVVAGLLSWQGCIVARHVVRA